MIHPRLFRIIVAVTCAYEVVAIVTKRLPTISRLSHNHPVFGGIVQGGLHVHFRTDAHGGTR